MAMPENIKRVTIATPQALHAWLSRPGAADSVMLVTPTDAPVPLTRDPLGRTLRDHGWEPGFRYTLGKTRIGQVIRRQK